MHIAIQSTTPKHYVFKKSPSTENSSQLAQGEFHSSSASINSSVHSIKMTQNPNNSYTLFKPYIKLKNVKTISHTYLISKNGGPFFQKILSHTY